MQIPTGLAKSSLSHRRKLFSHIFHEFKHKINMVIDCNCKRCLKIAAMRQKLVETPLISNVHCLKCFMHNAFHSVVMHVSVIYWSSICMHVSCSLHTVFIIVRKIYMLILALHFCGEQITDIFNPVWCSCRSKENCTDELYWFWQLWTRIALVHERTDHWKCNVLLSLCNFRFTNCHEFHVHFVY